MSTFYDYSVTRRDGSELSMKEFEGKVVLVVNTATGCGFTPQYKELESIYEEFHDKGLEILDIPCNQFAGQTPGTDEEVHEFCTLKYNTQFDQMKKSEINGENALDLYKFLKSQKTFEGFGKGLQIDRMKNVFVVVQRELVHDAPHFCACLKAEHHHINHGPQHKEQGEHIQRHHRQP